MKSIGLKKCQYGNLLNGEKDRTMEKNYDYYRKRSFVYSLTALIAMLFALAPLCFGVADATSGFVFENKHTITIIQLVCGSIGIIGYVLSVHNQNKGTEALKDIERKLRYEEYSKLLELIYEGKPDEAAAALMEYNTRYVR
jgi:hypothetical protein